MRLKPALWLGIGTLVASAAAVNNARSGIYVLQTRTDRYVFWIDPVGTTLPYLLLGAVALLQLGRPKGTVAMAPLGGFIAGWSVMIAFTLFISSTPKHPELMRSSTIGIAIVLTPIVYIVVSILIYRAVAAVVAGLARTGEGQPPAGR